MSTSASCPNGDPNFNKFLGLFMPENSYNFPAFRRKIFYSTCVPFRIILYTLIFYWRDQPAVSGLIIAGALFAIFNLSMNLAMYGRGNQWWSKIFQLVIAVLLLISASLTYFKKIPDYITPIILYVSVLGGLVQSFLVASC